MGGGRDYQKVAYYRYKRDANGNPIYMDNGEVAVERAYRYVRKTEYKRKQNAMATLQENNRSSMASRMASRMAKGKESDSLEERIKRATDTINQATDKKSLQAAMDSLGLGDKTSFIKELKNIEGAKAIALAVAEMNETFGGDVLSDVTTKGSFGSGIGGYRSVGHNEIHMNPKWFNDPEGTQGMLDRSVANGHFVKGETLQSLVKHEYGHLLQDKLTKDVRNSDQYKNNEAKIKSLEQSFDDITSNIPSSERNKMNEYLQKAWNSDSDRMIKTNLNKALKIVRDNTPFLKGGYWDAFSVISKQVSAVGSRNVMLYHAEMNGIKKICNSIGITKPIDVSYALTGGGKAYAKTNWAEAHAEMISDYMTNGVEGASATSILYVQAFAKEIGLKL